MNELKQAIIEGVRSLGAIPFFPRDEYAQEAIMTEISKFVDHADRLKWLIGAALNTMRKWENGIPELRGLYCTRFKPADGVEGYCTLPGFTPDDCEAQHMLQVAEYKALPPVFFEHKQIGASEPEAVVDQRTRTERDLETLASENRLRYTLNLERAPIRIQATQKRTPEETAALIRDLEAKLATKELNR